VKFVVTPEFVQQYETLDDTTVACVDDTIRQLLINHRSAWARQNRVDGEGGAGWLIAVRCGEVDLALYWREHTDESIVLLLLLTH
jgi:hypothetical protein